MKHYRGCGCKRTGCIKKYCECYQAKVYCSENCRCVDCKNSEGCVESMALLERHSNNTKICKNFAGCEESLIVSGGNGITSIKKIFEGSVETDNVTDGNLSNTDICKNFQGLEQKITSPRGENFKRKVGIQQANTAISTAIGLSGHRFLIASRKRKFHEFLNSNDKDPPNQRLINERKVRLFAIWSARIFARQATRN